MFVAIVVILYYHNNTVNANNDQIYRQKYSKYMQKLLGQTIFDLNDINIDNKSGNRFLLIRSEEHTSELQSH